MPPTNNGSSFSYTSFCDVILHSTFHSAGYRIRAGKRNIAVFPGGTIALSRGPDVVTSRTLESPLSLRACIGTMNLCSEIVARASRPQVGLRGRDARAI